MGSPSVTVAMVTIPDLCFWYFNICKNRSFFSFHSNRTPGPGKLNLHQTFIHVLYYKYNEKKSGQYISTMLKLNLKFVFFGKILKNGQKYTKQEIHEKCKF